MLAFPFSPVRVCYSVHFGCKMQRNGVSFPTSVGSAARNTCLISCSSSLACAVVPVCSASEMSDWQKLSQGPAVALVASSIFIHGAPRSIPWHFLCLWQVWLSWSIQSCALNCSKCFGYPAPHRGSPPHLSHMQMLGAFTALVQQEQQGRGCTWHRRGRPKVSLLC